MCIVWSSRSRIRIMRYTVAPARGERGCACAVGLLGIFEHVGAVPPVLVLDNRPAASPVTAKHHTVMADGTYMVHGWCLIVAIDGDGGEVLVWQWCAHESRAAYITLFSRIPVPDVPGNGRGCAACVRRAGRRGWERGSSAAPVARAARHARGPDL